MENDMRRVTVNDVVEESLRFRAYAPLVEMKDLRLSEKVRYEVMNESAKSVANAKMVMVFSIPSNTVLSEVAANDGIEFELELLEDGEAMITVDLDVLRPLEERLLEFDIYFAGLMTSPSYKVDCSAKLLVNQLELDAVAMEAVLRLENPAAL